MCGRIIGRVNNPKNAWLFTPEMGVDAAVNQAQLMGHLIAEEMSLGDMQTCSSCARGNILWCRKRYTPRHRGGQSVSQLNYPASACLVAVIHEGQLHHPAGDTVLQPWMKSWLSSTSRSKRPWQPFWGKKHNK